MKTVFAVSLIVFSSLLASAQAAPSYTIKSWKTGTVQAEPQTLHLPLSTTDRTYQKIINDIGGQPLYRLLVEPVAFIGPGDGIVAWHVYLTPPDSNQNLLLPSNSLEQEEYERPDYLWWFYPGTNRFAPIDAARVVQVQGSYVLLKAEDVRVNGSGQLEGMQLTITFSNTAPQPLNGPGE